jgi:short-subunit dehydrogenase
MRRLEAGRILIAGSIAGFMPGTYQAVYNGTKAFPNSFPFSLGYELKDTGPVTWLMPGTAGFSGLYRVKGMRQRRV